MEKYSEYYNEEAIVVLEKAKTIEQTDDRFCRLYSDRYDYDKLRMRHRNNTTGRLKPMGIFHYQTPDETPDAIVWEIINIHKRTKFWVLCSGGKDSITLVHYIATNYPENFMGVMHIKTGIGVAATTNWLIQYCIEKGWPLEICEPEPRDAYKRFVLTHGFPGAGIHNIIMGILKYSTMRRFAFEDEEKRFSHCLISGVRAFESTRRMGNYKGPIQRDGNLYFCAPFFKKTDEEIYEYLLVNGLKKTPVHEILGMSGECMCGSFAQYGERERIAIVDPDLDNFIHELEIEIQLWGSIEAKANPYWGDGKMVTEEEKEKILAEVFPMIDKLKIKELEQIVCGVECGPGTMRGATNF